MNTTGPAGVADAAENPGLAEMVAVLFPQDVCDPTSWNKFGATRVHLLDGSWRPRRGLSCGDSPKSGKCGGCRPPHRGESRPRQDEDAWSPVLISRGHHRACTAPARAWDVLGAMNRERSVACTVHGWPRNLRVVAICRRAR